MVIIVAINDKEERFPNEFNKIPKIKYFPW
jgi:hypothetical protein